MTAEQLLLAGVGISLSINAVFLRRLVQKLDTVYDWICGNPDKPGIADSVREIQIVLGLTPIERRQTHRRKGGS